VSVGKGRALPETLDCIGTFIMVAPSAAVADQVKPQRVQIWYRVTNGLIDGGSILNMITLHVVQKMNLE
jgi:hypothetical protein